MLAIILSVLIFGLVHPLSIVLMDSGLPLSYFCILYVGIRVIFQLPMFIAQKHYSINIKKHLALIVFLGLIGASLQYFEFKAIEVGLTPGTVTFLMFTYPIWISIFKMFKGSKDYILIFKVIAALAGMFFVSNAALEEIKNITVIYPLLAGLSIALWIVISNKLRKSGFSSIKLSTYYDLFSLIFLIMNFNVSLITDFGIFTQWLSINNGITIVLYSLLVGLLPNLLFYYGNKNVDSVNSGMIMAFEPILSTAYSCLLWGTFLTENFLLGAILIILANTPFQIIKKIKNMEIKMKNLNLFVLLITLISFEVSASQILYDCNSSRPEMAGSHNMVLFGDPSDKLYTYHLPLFKGEVNGQSGHVFMHVYQGIWDVELDQMTIASYKNKFNKEKSDINPFPFFSISPRGQKFKVPEMMCNHGFITKVLSVYGHVENNPDFPSPELLVNQLTDLKVNKTVYARRFDGTSKDQLTYILFGTNKQLYMAHYLTDDENSFDQIVAIKIDDEDLKSEVIKGELNLVTVPIETNKNLNHVFGSEKLSRQNNKFSLPVEPLEQTVNIEFQGKSFKVKILAEVYFNSNADLKVSF